MWHELKTFYAKNVSFFKLYCHRIILDLSVLISLWFKLFSFLTCNMYYNLILGSFLDIQVQMGRQKSGLCHAAK